MIHDSAKRDLDFYHVLDSTKEERERLEAGYADHAQKIGRALLCQRLEADDGLSNCVAIDPGCLRRKSMFQERRGGS